MSLRSETSSRDFDVRGTTQSTSAAASESSHERTSCHKTCDSSLRPAQLDLKAAGCQVPNVAPPGPARELTEEGAKLVGRGNA